MGLSSECLRALDELSFVKPTEIQEQAIPRLMDSDIDLIGLAQTGTGKTAAFGLPLIEKIDPTLDWTQGLILSPTRELGKQIAEQLELFSKYKEKINVLPVYGGAAITVQMKALKKTQHIIIATPGRLIDLIKRKAVKLNALRFLVLDEADEMLNMGFKDELDEILKYTPDDKNVWLFSATMPDYIKGLVSSYMTDPFEISINPKEEVNTNIKHRYVTVQRKDKAEALKRFLDIHNDMRGVVFCKTKRDTQDLAELLLQFGYKVDALHGDLAQAQRDRVMKRFKNNELQVLIATDVAARGIDVNDLTHVFHFTLPDDASYYTHRSGRTARAGKKGVSIAFLGGRDKHRIHRLEKELNIEFKKILIPENDEVVQIRVKKWCKDVLSTQVSPKLDNELISQAQMYFDELSKEELVAKMLMRAVDELQVGTDRNLNDEERKSSRGGRSNRGGSGRHGGRGGSDRGRSRGRDRGSRGRKSGGERGGRGQSRSNSRKGRGNKK